MLRIFLMTLFSSLLLSQTALAHCEIPCGIYDDEMRLSLISEHITTIAKSMKMITELAEEKDKNYNQVVRWVENKEKHAQEIQDIVSRYFMTQRIKPVGDKEGELAKKYAHQLELLHELLVYAMKTKQTTDQEHTAKLRSLLNNFRKSYLGADSGKHAH